MLVTNLPIGMDMRLVASVQSRHRARLTPPRMVKIDLAGLLGDAQVQNVRLLIIVRYEQVRPLAGRVAILIRTERVLVRRRNTALPISKNRELKFAQAKVSRIRLRREDRIAREKEHNGMSKVQARQGGAAIIDVGKRVECGRRDPHKRQKERHQKPSRRMRSSS